MQHNSIGLLIRSLPPALTLNFDWSDIAEVKRDAELTSEARRDDPNYQYLRVSGRKKKKKKWEMGRNRLKFNYYRYAVTNN